MLDESECVVDRWMKLGGTNGDKTGCNGGRWLKLYMLCPVAFFGTLLVVFSDQLARTERWLFTEV